MATTEKSPRVIFDVDVEIEKRKSDSALKDPFVARIAGRDITLTDANDLDWQIHLEVQENPIRVLRHCMSEEDRRYLQETKGVPVAVFTALVEAYREHYGLVRKGDETSIL
jgi:hypothetical protein